MRKYLTQREQNLAAMQCAHSTLCALRGMSKEHETNEMIARACTKLYNALNGIPLSYEEENERYSISNFLR